MNKPPFDPNQPFDTLDSKPPFDPNQPFTSDDQNSTPMGGKAPLSMLAGEVLKRTPMGMVANSLKEDPQQVLPVAGSLLGGAVAGPVGIAAGAGLGQIAKRMVDVGTGKVNPSDASDPLKESIGPMAQTAFAGVTEVGGVKNAIQNTAQSMARRALGFNKPMLKKPNFGVDEANQVGQTMMDKGVIKFGSGSEKTLERASDLLKSSGKSIEGVGDVLSKQGKLTVDPNAIGVEVANQLTPKFSGGAYDAEKKVVGEILDTIGAHGNEPLTFESAQALKSKLAELAKFNQNTDAVKANLYRRAYGIVTKSLDDAIGAASSGTPLEQQFKSNKAIYGQTKRAVQALTDKRAGEAANNIVSLRGAAAAGYGMATGDIPKTLEAIGAWELLRRRGEGSAATALNAINKSDVSKRAKDALIAEFISRMQKGQSNGQ